MRHPDGLPGWLTLLTPDPAAVQPFYQDLFDWSFADHRAPDGGTGLTCKRGDKQVASIDRMPDALAAAGVPPVWTASIIVADLDATLTMAEQAGGSVLVAATDVGAEGRLGSAADPSGGAIGLWQPGNHDGAEILREPGSLSWVELHSRDLDVALPFYAEVFGWRWETLGADHTQVALLDSVKGLNKAVASARPTPQEAPADAPSYWLTFFAADDPVDSARRAVAAGGSVIVEPQRQEGVGTYCGLADPRGARFMVMRFEMPSAGTIIKAVGARLFGSKK